jgi:hypothetical protein
VLLDDWCTPPVAGDDVRDGIPRLLEQPAADRQRRVFQRGLMNLGTRVTLGQVGAAHGQA